MHIIIKKKILIIKKIKFQNYYNISTNYKIKICDLFKIKIFALE